jgi:O-antigen ligase
MAVSSKLSIHSTADLSAKPIVRWLVNRPLLSNGVLAGFFALISLATGNNAYLIIAAFALGIAVLLATSGFLAGILWVLGLSTVLGFYQRLILFGSGGTPSSDYVRLALELGILFYTGVLIIRMLQKRTLRRLLVLDILVTFYLLLSTVYALNLFHVTPSITIYGWRWICIPILLYYLGRVIGFRPNAIDVVNKYLIILLLLQAGYGAYQSVAGYPFFEEPWIAQRLVEQSRAAVEDSMFIAGKARIPALMEGHTSSGFFIPILFLWVLFLPSSAFSRKWRWLRQLALLCGVLFLLFSNERSAIGMVAVGVSIVVFLQIRRKIGIGVFLVGIPMLALALWVTSQIDSASIPWNEDTIAYRRLLELLNPLSSGTFRGRFEVYWPVYWEYFLANPLGYGLGAFHQTSATVMTEWGRSPRTPHNMYLQILLETGVAGILVFISIVAVYFTRLYMRSRKCIEPLQKGVVVGAIASLVAFLAIGMANQPIETFPIGIHFWFLMGLVTTCMTQRSQDSHYA